MVHRTSLNVSLTPELEQFVRERLATGRYRTASEVVREGLRLLEHQERHREETLAELKAKLKRGSDQAERGELLNPDGAIGKIDAWKRRQAEGNV